MPLLSSIGGGSEYAYRGNYDDWPNPFSFDSQSNLLPGVLATATTTITGINYKAVVRGTNNVEISINGGAFSSSPQTIRTGQTLTIRYQTTSGTDGDFNKTFNTTITVGKRTASWTVSTKIKDTLPNVFNFDTINQANPSTPTESNTITLSGLEPSYTTYAFISSGTATFSVNGGSYVSNAFISNNDTIRLKQTSSALYNTSVSSEISVGDYATSFTVTTRSADTVIDPITFTAVTNVNINVEQLSNTITISGADPGVPLIANISNNAGISINSAPTYVSGPVTVFNGNTIRIRIPGSVLIGYATTTPAVLNISGVLATFNATTRPRPIKSFPDAFSFTAATNVELQTAIQSNTITLSGMTSGDFGTATISGPSAEFKVIRNGTILRDYSSSSYQVLNGDQIQLRITSGGELANVQATFSVSGTDTFTNISGTPGTTTGNWLVTSKGLVCSATDFSSTLTSGTVTTDTAGQLKSISFTISGLNAGCDNIVTTSDANSYVRVNGSQGTSLTVSNGDTVEVYMTSPAGGTTRTTTVTVRRPNGANAVSANWSITTTTLPVVNITLSPSSIYTGSSSTLSWSVDYGTILVDSNFGAISVNGSQTVNPLSNTTYTLTARGPGGQASGSGTLTVGPKPPTITLTASPTSAAYDGSTTLTWSSTGATSVSSSNFGASATSGSVTLYNLTSSQTYSITVSGLGGSATASVQVSVAGCVATTKNTGFAIFKQATIYYGNGSKDGFRGMGPTEWFFVSSTPQSYSVALPNKPQFSYGQVQDHVNNVYRNIFDQRSPNTRGSGTVSRPPEEGAISHKPVSWVTLFDNYPSYSNTSSFLDQLTVQMQYAYDEDFSNGPPEGVLVKTAQFRTKILDACGNPF
jgi:hypothetical protein